MDQPGKVANLTRGQLNRENEYSPCVPENLISRDGFSRPVPRQPARLHTQAESGAYGISPEFHTTVVQYSNMVVVEKD